MTATVREEYIRLKEDEAKESSKNKADPTDQNQSGSQQ